VRLGELATKLGGRLSGDPDVEITGVAGIHEATEGDLTFLANPRFEAEAERTRAGAILVAANHRRLARPVIELPDPYRGFLEALKILRPDTPPPTGVHPSAILGPGVKLGSAVSIGAHAVIEADAEIGDRTVVGPLTYIGRGSRVGKDALIYPGVVIREDCEIGDRVIIHSGSVIGADGFGFLPDERRHVKIPQVGRVVIEDDVEIGAGCAIDRGTVAETRIGRGTKFDNLVHIGHNVRIGENSLVVAQVGIGGSTVVGRGVTLAGQVGIVGHVEIGDGAQIGAQAGVINSVPAKARMWATPSMPLAQAKRVIAAQKRTPEILRVIAALERRVAELEARLGLGNGDAVESPHTKAPAKKSAGSRSAETA
jgi:UDP-3-O-[3-hydroxymyristoyl] glucosamine N-acyltransferase